MSKLVDAYVYVCPISLNTLMRFTTLIRLSLCFYNKLSEVLVISWRFGTQPTYRTNYWLIWTPGCIRFLPLDCLTFCVLSSYWTPHIKSVLNTASLNGPQCCRLKCQPHAVKLDQFPVAACTDALCIHAPNRLIVRSFSFKCRSRRS